ncbi:MAG: acyltransferase [Chitinophagaceae bacterium]
MKENVKKILSLFYKLRAYLPFLMSNAAANKVAMPGMFYKSFYSLKGTGNKLLISGETETSDFFVEGSGNTIIINNSAIGKSIITVSGDNNRIDFEDGVILRNSTLTIRGSSCTIKIGKATTFGGVRIINVGKDNEVVIGAGCLFSDFIEIWASDTHPVYNEQHEIINAEKSIYIEDKVWVGARVIILKGVTIEYGSIVGMGSMVVNNVPKSSISVGNPNRIVKNNISWDLHY